MKHTTDGPQKQIAKARIAPPIDSIDQSDFYLEEKDQVFGNDFEEFLHEFGPERVED